MAPLRLPNAVSARREGTVGSLRHDVTEDNHGAAEGSRGQISPNVVSAAAPTTPWLGERGVWA